MSIDIDNVTERVVAGCRIAGDKEEYMEFFQAKLKKYGVKSPAELDAEKKKKFFDEIEKDWTGDEDSPDNDKDD
jgi:hypothetical protein